MKKALSLCLSVMLVITTVVTCFTFSAAAYTEHEGINEGFDGEVPTLVDAPDVDQDDQYFGFNGVDDLVVEIKDDDKGQDGPYLSVGSPSDHRNWGRAILLKKDTKYKFSIKYKGNHQHFRAIGLKDVGAIPTGVSGFSDAIKAVDGSGENATVFRNGDNWGPKSESAWGEYSFTFNTGDYPYFVFAFSIVMDQTVLYDDLTITEIAPKTYSEITDEMDSSTYSKIQNRVDSELSAGAEDTDSWFGGNGYQNAIPYLETAGGVDGGEYFRIFANGEHRFIGRATLLKKNTNYTFSIYYKNGNANAMFMQAALYNKVTNVGKTSASWNSQVPTINTANAKVVYQSGEWSPNHAEWTEITFDFSTGDDPYFAWAITVPFNCSIYIDKLSIIETVGDVIYDSLDDTVPEKWDSYDGQNVGNGSFFILNGEGKGEPKQAEADGYKNGYLSVNAAEDNVAWGRVFKVQKNTSYVFSMWFKGDHQKARAIGLETLANGIPTAQASGAGGVKTLGFDNAVKYYDSPDWGPDAKDDWGELTFEFNSGECEYFVISFTIAQGTEASYDEITISKALTDINVTVLSNGVESIGAGHVTYTAAGKGMPVTFNAYPEVNCEFLGWFNEDDSNPVSTELTYTTVVNSSEFSLIAKFVGDENYFIGGTFQDESILDFNSSTKVSTPTENGWTTSVGTETGANWAAKIMTDGKGVNNDNYLQVGYNWGHGFARQISIVGGKTYKIGFWMKATDTDTKFMAFSVYGKPAVTDTNWNDTTYVPDASNVLLEKVEWLSCSEGNTWEYKEYVITTEEGMNVLELNWTGSFDPAVKTICLDEISVTEAKAGGDINGDGDVTDADVQLFREYIAGWDVEVNENALDVNRDGNIDYKDIDIIARYLAGWPVEL